MQSIGQIISSIVYLYNYNPNRLLLIIVLLLLIRAVVSIPFSLVAKEKGYKEFPIFVYCLLFGAIGYFLVHTLPNRNLYTPSDKSFAPENQNSPTE